MRIFDAAGKEVPCLVERDTESRTRSVRRPCASTVVSLHEQDGGLEVTVRLDDRAPAAGGLSIVTPLTDFERRVRVSGSNDGQQWTPLVGKGLLFDYSRYMDISNHEIRLPKNDFRQFKVSIADITNVEQSPLYELTRKWRHGREVEEIEKTVRQRRPFRMDRLEFWGEGSETLSEGDRQTAYPVVKFEVPEDAAEKTTTIEVATRREPLVELILATSSRNFSRQAVVQAPVKRGIRTEWVEVGRGEVSLLDFGGYYRQRLGIAFPQRREAQYRIVIQNEDNPPLAITGVAARGNVYRVVFLAAAKESYRLCYGSEEADPPRYDVAAVLAPLRQSGAASEARLGAEIANLAVAAASAPTWRGLVNNALFLGGAIVVLVVVLGWALYHAARRINELPKT